MKANIILGTYHPDTPFSTLCLYLFSARNSSTNKMKSQTMFKKKSLVLWTLVSHFEHHFFLRKIHLLVSNLLNPSQTHLWAEFWHASFSTSILIQTLPFNHTPFYNHPSHMSRSFGHPCILPFPQVFVNKNLKKKKRGPRHCFCFESKPTDPDQHALLPNTQQTHTLASKKSKHTLSHATQHTPTQTLYTTWTPRTNRTRSPPVLDAAERSGK
jgi:hypothetical protein